MVVTEALKARYNAGRNPSLYFFRDQTGFEVDLIKSEHRQLTPIEIKAARTFQPEFIRNLKKFEKISDRIRPGAIIYAGDHEQMYDRHQLLRYENTQALFG